MSRMWVARERDGLLCMSFDKPPIRETKYGFWKAQKETYAICIPSDFLPELKWEDEPIEIELKIKKNENTSIS